MNEEDELDLLLELVTDVLIDMEIDHKLSEGEPGHEQLYQRLLAEKITMRISELERKLKRSAWDSFQRNLRL